MFYPQPDDQHPDEQQPVPGGEPQAAVLSAPGARGRWDLVALAVLVLAILAVSWLMFWPKAAQTEVSFQQVGSDPASVSAGLSDDGKYLIVEDVWPENCGLPVSDVRFDEEGVLRVRHATINACFRGCGDPTPTYYRIGPFQDSQDSVQVVKKGDLLTYAR